MELDQLFNQLWKEYTTQNPSALTIFNLFAASEEKVLNDHIAFRTFNDPRMNTDVLARPFLENGYHAAGSYRFEKKHLNATHFEHPGKRDAPRVFISELIIEDFSPFLQQTIRKTIEKVDPALWQSPELIFKGSIFGVPSYETYQKLREESEYAAWLYVHGFRANHFTISINSLENFEGIEEVNEFLKGEGFLLNNSGGEIKGTRKQLLMQSSTKAEIVSMEFEEGSREVPACYYEFAERFTDDAGKLFSGFIAGSADKIFESTDYYLRK